MICDVYFNLTKKLYSIRAREGQHKGRVIGHCKSVVMQNVSFKVSQASRNRVLRDKQKNVHAVARGVLVLATGEGFTVNPDQVAPIDRLKQNGKPFTYCPYRSGSFQTVESDGTHRDVETASELILDTSGNRYLITT